MFALWFRLRISLIKYLAGKQSFLINTDVTGSDAQLSAKNPSSFLYVMNSAIGGPAEKRPVCIEMSAL